MENNKKIKKLTDIIKESSLSRIWKHVTTHDSGTITSFRGNLDCGDGAQISKSDNKSSNSKLKSKLLSMGYGVTKVNGTYIENYGSSNARKVKEETFIVIDLQNKGKLKKDLIKLGTYFNQDSITYSKPNGDYYLISTNKCPNGYPGKGSIGKSVKLGKPFFGKDGEFHSTIKGRPFVFEVIESKLDTIRSFSIPEIRSIKYWGDQIIL